jgi:hypothetical protein
MQRAVVALQQISEYSGPMAGAPAPTYGPLAVETIKARRPLSYSGSD